MASEGPLSRDGCALSDSWAGMWCPATRVYLCISESFTMAASRLHGAFVADFSASFTLVADHGKSYQKERGSALGRSKASNSE